MDYEKYSAAIVYYRTVPIDYFSSRVDIRMSIGGELSQVMDLGVMDNFQIPGFIKRFAQFRLAPYLQHPLTDLSLVYDSMLMYADLGVSPGNLLAEYQYQK